MSLFNRMNEPYFGSKLNIRQKYEREAAYYNTQTELYWYNRLLEVALNGIVWENLPPEIDPRYLEMCLLFNGTALFFYDDKAEAFAVWRWLPLGNYNHYHDPYKRRAVPEMGQSYKRTLTQDDSVICWNNQLRTPDLLAVRYYTRKLAEADRTIDVNIAAQKTPKMVLCSEEQRLTFENLIKKYDGNLPFIFGARNLRDYGEITTLDTSAPFIADSLSTVKRQLLAEAWTYWGIENSSSEKKERLVSDEVSSNLGAVEMARQCRLNARQQFADQVNRMFGDMLPLGPIMPRFNAPKIAIDPAPGEIDDNYNDGGINA